MFVLPQMTSCLQTILCKHPFLVSCHFSHYSSVGFRNAVKMEGHQDMSNITVVNDPQLLDNKIDKIRSAGPAKLQVIADFDATLTKYFVNGRRGISSHGLLRQGNPEYDAKRQELYDYYHPLEFSPTIPIEEKTKLMEEWWGKTHNLLIEGGLTYDAIKESVASSSIAFREGVVDLFQYLEEKDIPVLIFSAGLADIIEEVLRQKFHRSFKNVKIVSNRMVFENGHLVSFKGKLIHSLNKNERALDMAAPVHEHFGDPNGQMNDTSSVKKRTNVLLLGDHLGDLGMSDGLEYETRISVGFLNDNVANNLDNYRKAFDVVYLITFADNHQITCQPIVAASYSSVTYIGGRVPVTLPPRLSADQIFGRVSNHPISNDAPMWGVVKLVSQLFPTI